MLETRHVSALQLMYQFPDSCHGTGFRLVFYINTIEHLFCIEHVTGILSVLILLFIGVKHCAIGRLRVNEPQWVRSPILHHPIIRF